MEQEINDLMGNPHGKHNQSRTDYRNGYHYRSLLTGYGDIRDIRVRRIRQGGIEFKTIERYQQRTKEVEV